MKSIKNIRIISATLFGLSLLSFAGNLWAMEIDDSESSSSWDEVETKDISQYDPKYGIHFNTDEHRHRRDKTIDKEQQQKVRDLKNMIFGMHFHAYRKQEQKEPTDKHLHAYRMFKIDDRLNTYEKLLRNTLQEEALDGDVLTEEEFKQKLEIFKSKIIKFEFWNKSSNTIYIKFGNLNNFTRKIDMGTMYFTDENWTTEDWVKIEPSERIFSPRSMTQFVYSLNENPQSVSDVEYFIFNPEENNKVFIKLEEKGKDLKFMAQEGTSSSGLPLGKLYKFGREKLRVKRGKFSVTQTGLSLENSIEDRDIEWLPYLYLPYNTSDNEFALYVIRTVITECIKNYNDQEFIKNAISSIKRTILDTPHFFNRSFRYNWTPAHEVALWKTSDIYENNEDVKKAINAIEETLTNKLGEQIMDVPDMWERTPHDVQKSIEIQKAVNEFYIEIKLMHEVPDQYPLSENILTKIDLYNIMAGRTMREALNRAKNNT